MQKLLETEEEKELGEFEEILRTVTIVIAVVIAVVVLIPVIMQQLIGPKFAIGKNFSIDVGTTSVLVLPANEGRRYASFVNDSLETIYLSLGQEAVIGQGIRLNPEGGWYEITTANLFLGDIYAIATGIGKLSVVEGKI